MKNLLHKIKSAFGAVVWWLLWHLAVRVFSERERGVRTPNRRGQA